jgi:hypothetical protein
MWPPTSARVRRAGGVEKFSSPLRKTFFDSIDPKLPLGGAAGCNVRFFTLASNLLALCVTNAEMGEVSEQGCRRLKIVDAADEISQCLVAWREIFKEFIAEGVNFRC